MRIRLKVFFSLLRARHDLAVFVLGGWCEMMVGHDDSSRVLRRFANCCGTIVELAKVNAAVDDGAARSCCLRSVRQLHA
jgi:hypothetical protein